MGNKDRYPVTGMTGLFGVSRSAYYRWEKQGVSDQWERADGELAELLGPYRRSITGGRERYGYRSNWGTGG